eukprot:762750-Ditylum_brightwellii.AAC.1
MHLPNNQQKEVIFYPVTNYAKHDDIGAVTDAPLLPPQELPWPPQVTLADFPPLQRRGQS